MLRKRKNQGITLISLIVTIIILIILAGVSLNLILGENGIIQKSKVARDEYNKQAAIEKMNLKIINIQMAKYEEELRMPTLQELAIALEQDDEIQYVNATKTVASTQDIDFITATSIFTKLKAYAYEFEIDNTLKIASINETTINTDSNYIRNYTIDNLTEDEKIAQLYEHSDAINDYATNSSPNNLVYGHWDGSGTYIKKITLRSSKLGFSKCSKISVDFYHFLHTGSDGVTTYIEVYYKDGTKTEKNISSYVDGPINKNGAWGSIDPWNLYSVEESLDINKEIDYINFYIEGWDSSGGGFAGILGNITFYEILKN